MNGYFLSKHIPNDLKTWPKFKKMVLGTIEIWRKCPHLEPLWGGALPLLTTKHDKAILQQHQVNVFKALVMSSKLNIFVKYLTPLMPEIFKDLDLTTVHYNLEKDWDLIAIKTAADQVDQVGRFLLWVITAHLWIGSSIEIHILFQSMLQNIELELQNCIFFIGHWTIGIYISQPFMWSLNFQKLGSIAGNCFHFLFYRRINWSDTIHEDCRWSLW